MQPLYRTIYSVTSTQPDFITIFSYEFYIPSRVRTNKESTFRRRNYTVSQSAINKTREETRTREISMVKFKLDVFETDDERWWKSNAGNIGIPEFKDVHIMENRDTNISWNIRADRVVLSVSNEARNREQWEMENGLWGSFKIVESGDMLDAMAVSVTISQEIVPVQRKQRWKVDGKYYLLWFLLWSTVTIGRKCKKELSNRIDSLSES